jgi:hypothetical protein
VPGEDEFTQVVLPSTDMFMNGFPLRDRRMTISNVTDEIVSVRVSGSSA